MIALVSKLINFLFMNRLKSISICDFCNEMLFSKEEAEKHIQLHLEKLK